LTTYLVLLLALNLTSGTDLPLDNTGIGLKPSLSILNPSRLNMAQGIQYSYMYSNGKGYSLGLYQNTLTYKLSEPLTLNINLGYAFDPTNNLNQGNLLGGFRLTYQPNEFFFFDVSYGFSPEEMSDRYIFDPYRPFNKQSPGVLIR
jgi:hypothetical protein